MDTTETVSQQTRSEVRARLAQALDDLIGGEAQRSLAAEFSDLATGSDREVIESYRRFDKSYHSRGPVDTNFAPSAIGGQIRDLFEKALQKMKSLPPDPRGLEQDPLPIIPAQTKIGRKR